VVSSQAIAQFVRSVTGRPITIIPCTVDVETFQVTTPIGSDCRCLIGFPDRRRQAKCTNDAIDALTKIRSQLGGRLQPWCFGYDEMPTLPHWINHVQAPNDGVRRPCCATLEFDFTDHTEGFESWASGLPRVTQQLLAAGHAEQTVAGVLGWNFHCFYRRVEATAGQS